jgi:hypothetical protein
MRRLSLLVRAGALVLFASQVIACGGGAAVTKPEKLREAVTQYNRHIRWNNTGAAAAYIPLDKRAAFKEAREDDEIVVLSLDVGAVDADYEDDVAKVLVRYEWREPDGITVKKTRIRQLWKYVNEHWLLHSKSEVKKKPKKDRSKKNAEGEDDKKKPLKLEDRF